MLRYEREIWAIACHADGEEDHFLTEGWDRRVAEWSEKDAKRLSREWKNGRAVKVRIVATEVVE